MFCFSIQSRFLRTECTVCGRLFENRNQVKRHSHGFQSARGDKWFQCLICDRHMDTGADSRRHYCVIFNNCGDCHYPLYPGKHPWEHECKFPYNVPTEEQTRRLCEIERALPYSFFTEYPDFYEIMERELFYETFDVPTAEEALFLPRYNNKLASITRSHTTRKPTPFDVPTEQQAMLLPRYNHIYIITMHL